MRLQQVSKDQNRIIASKVAKDVVLRFAVKTREKTANKLKNGEKLGERVKRYHRRTEDPTARNFSNIQKKLNIFFHRFHLYFESISLRVPCKNHRRKQLDQRT